MHPNFQNSKSCSVNFEEAPESMKEISEEAISVDPFVLLKLQLFRQRFRADRHPSSHCLGLPPALVSESSSPFVLSLPPFE